MVKRSHISLNMHYIPIPTMYNCVSKRLRSYAFNVCITYWGNVIETHLMDSPLAMCEAEQNPALKNFITMIMLVHVEIDLMELST